MYKAQVQLQILLHRRKKEQVSRVTFCQAESTVTLKINSEEPVPSLAMLIFPALKVPAFHVTSQCFTQLQQQSTFRCKF